MEAEIIPNTDQVMNRAPSQMHCAHQRLIAQVLTPSGKKTGKVRCLECESILDDPQRGQP